VKGGAIMGSELIKKKEKDECNCCIEILDSIVILICGEVEVDDLRNSLKAAISEMKSNKN
jgi:hypothetical protein